MVTGIHFCVIIMHALCINFVVTSFSFCKVVLLRDHKSRMFGRTILYNQALLTRELAK